MMLRKSFVSSRNHHHVFYAFLVANCLAITTVKAFSSVASTRRGSWVSSRPPPSITCFSWKGEHVGTPEWCGHLPKNISSWPTTAHITTTWPSFTALRLSSDGGFTPTPSSIKTRATAIYALILCNLTVFLMDKVFGYAFVARRFYLFHRRWKWWQLITSCFCHADRFHLSNNLFLLLLFGRSVEDDQGWGGLLLSYFFCGIFASLASVFLLPKNTISIGASGAVFGLFAVSTLAKISWRDIDWRKVVEVAVLGEFVFRQLASEISTAAGGGRAGINHVAHLSGAAAGAILVFGMRATVAKFESEEKNMGKKKGKDYI